MKFIIYISVIYASLNLVSCQSKPTKSSTIQWQASLGSTGSGTLAPKIPVGNKPAATPTTPQPIKIVKTTPAFPQKQPTLPPTQPPTRPPPPPTRPPTAPTTTKASPVIMVQQSLSGVSGPSSILSQAKEWIETSPGGPSGMSRKFSGIDVASTSNVVSRAGSSRPSRGNQHSKSSNQMLSFVGMLTPEQKRALRAMLDGTEVVTTTTPKPTTPAPKADMQALKMKMMQSLMRSRNSPNFAMKAMLAAMAGSGGGIGMGSMGGMGGMGGMDASALMEALGGGTTDPGEQMPNQRFGGRQRGSMFGGRGGGRGFGRGGSGLENSRRDPMMQRMLLERQMRSRRPGFDPSEMPGRGEMGEGLNPLMLAAMMNQGGAGGLAGATGGMDMASLLSGGAGGGGADMSSIFAAMGGGGGAGGGMSPMDMMAMMSAMESASNTGTTKKNGTEKASTNTASTGGMDMSSMFGGGMGGMSEMQLMMSLMGGADPPGLKSSSSTSISNSVPALPKENSLKKSASFSAKTKSSANSQHIPDWLMKKLINTGNASPQSIAKPPSPPTTTTQSPPVTYNLNNGMFGGSSFGTSHQAGHGAMTHSIGTQTATSIGVQPGVGSMATGGMKFGGMPGLASQMAPISSNMSPAQIETMFTAIGLIPDQIRDISGGQHGMATLLPEDIKVQAIHMRARGMTPDQIADTLGDVMQARMRGGMLMG